jgi:hypothetical protein
MKAKSSPKKGFLWWEFSILKLVRVEGIV